MNTNSIYADLLEGLVRERDCALSVFDNSENTLIQDFAFIDAKACNEKIAKLQEIARANDEEQRL